MRTVSQNAYKKMQRIVREELAAKVAARKAALALLASGAHKRSWDFDKARGAYLAARFSLTHYKAQLDAAQPNTEKQPYWSPAARARNGFATPQ
jgi:hypothetical protein